MGVHAKNEQIDDADRAKMLELHEQGITRKYIAERFGVSEGGLSHILERARRKRDLEARDD